MVLNGFQYHMQVYHLMPISVNHIGEHTVAPEEDASKSLPVSSDIQQVLCCLHADRMYYLSIIMRLTPIAFLTTFSFLPLQAQIGGNPNRHPSAVELGVLTGPGVAPIVPGREIDPQQAPKPKLDKRIVNRVAATVNGRPITSSEVTFRLMPIFAQLSAQFPRQGPEFTKRLAKEKNEIINDLVERELVMSDFETKGYQMRDAFIDQEINRVIIEDYNGNRDRFLQDLSKSGMTIRGFRDTTKRRLIVMAMRSSKYDHEIPPTPDEINREYNKTKLQFRDLTKDQIKFKKIFIPMVGDDPTQTPEVQLKLSELIVDEIKGGKATFEEMAQRYSRDQMAEKGGDWPMIERSQLAAEFAAIIFDAKTGQVVGPLIDPNGFTIVVVEKKQLAPPPPLSKIREQIDAQVRSNRSNERYKQWVERLRQKALIKKYI